MSRPPEVCSTLNFLKSPWSRYRPCQIPRQAPRRQVQQPLQSDLPLPRQYHHPHLHDGSCPAYVNPEHCHFRFLYTHSPNLALPFQRKAILTPDPTDEMPVPQDPLSPDFPLCALYTGQSIAHRTPPSSVVGYSHTCLLCQANPAMVLIQAGAQCVQAIRASNRPRQSHQHELKRHLDRCEQLLQEVASSRRGVSERPSSSSSSVSPVPESITPVANTPPVLRTWRMFYRDGRLFGGPTASW